MPVLLQVITSSGYRIGPFEVESALKVRELILPQRSIPLTSSKPQTHAAVVESAAVGSPDLSRGEVVKAFVILSDEYRDKVLGKKDKEKELILDMQVRPNTFIFSSAFLSDPAGPQNHFKKMTAPYKVPREIEFVDTLPKTVSGKIRRIELRELEKQRKADIVKQQKAKL